LVRSACRTGTAGFGRCEAGAESSDIAKDAVSDEFSEIVFILSIKSSPRYDLRPKGIRKFLPHQKL